MMELSRLKVGAGRASRPRALAGLLLVAITAVTLPAALAWACAPQAALSFNSATFQYFPGDPVVVSGSNFPTNTPVALTLHSPSGSTTAIGSGVSSSSVGTFQASFTLPSNAALGQYIVSGQAGTTSARETFRVVARSVAAPPAASTPVPPAPAAANPFAGKTINGTADGDTLTGTAFADVINCGAGNDVVKGGGGNDVINCGGGKDRVDGGAGKDRLLGGSGNDKLSGGSGGDKLYGGAGKDTLRGGKGKDMLSGGAGNDRLYRDGADVLRGGGGKNSVVSVGRR